MQLGEGRRNNTRTSDAKLVKGEEVLILRQNGGDAKASGPVNYDVLRWDGACASLSDSQMTDAAPGQPQNALIGWRYFDVRIQRALFKDPAIAKAQLAVTNVCKGSTGGACAHAIHNLSAAIASAVRKGIELPRQRHVATRAARKKFTAAFTNRPYFEHRYHGRLT